MTHGAYGCEVFGKKLECHQTVMTLESLGTYLDL